ncbi:Dihydropteroate synthase-like protein [Ochromonadaceae sp. CCMP2298]|nr:Dihydropteroate synthase-like protein [Ochromonadaceae sp. CCMP2298]
MTTAASQHSVYIALGSNMGDRASAILEALHELKALGTVACTSHLYETAPMYHADQPSFLNAVCKFETVLPPLQLLDGLQAIEGRVGRRTSFRNGPRLIDLDLLLHGAHCLASERLTIPHERIAERAFVLKPLCDLLGPHELLPGLLQSPHTLLALLPEADRSEVRRVLPPPHGEAHTRQQSMVMIMGILNVTPDSFSDGGAFDNSVEVAVQQALLLEQQGATIIDIGGESTRPGASAVSVEEELRRTVPVIRAIRAAGSRCLISIDTRKAAVATEAIAAGADIVNDVSAGTHDAAMLPAVGALGVPFVAMHMRGDPSSMQALAQYHSGDVVGEVAAELSAQLRQLDLHLPRWLQIVDPGIGFAKGHKQNVELLRPANLRRLKQLLGNRPLLVGLSRKRFLGTILQETMAQRLDLATAAGCCAAILGGADILRVHSVVPVRTVCDSFQALVPFD